MTTNKGTRQFWLNDKINKIGCVQKLDRAFCTYLPQSIMNETNTCGLDKVPDRIRIQDWLMTRMLLVRPLPTSREMCVLLKDSVTGWALILLSLRIRTLGNIGQISICCENLMGG